MANMRSRIVGLTPPYLLDFIRAVWRQAHGLRVYDFKGSWPMLAAVPGTRDGIDPWAQSLPIGWQATFDSPATPTVDATGKLILPLLVSQFVGPLTVLDFGGGPAVGLGDIRRYARNLDLSRVSYVLVETPAMCREIRAKLTAFSGTAVEEIPDALPHPLIVNAASSLYYLDDWRGTIDRLTALAPEIFVVTRTPVSDEPTYARQLYSVPHRVIPTWVFNRAEFIAAIESRSYRLAFSVDHDLPLTHKDAPGPSVISSMVFVRREPNL